MTSTPHNPSQEAFTTL